MGRPTKLTPELQKQIVAYITAGSYIETAAAAAGIDKTTLHDWLRRGKAGDKPFDEFSHAVERAMGQADMRDLAVIDRASQDGVWQAAAWKLERKHPDKWGRTRVEVTGVDGGPITHADATQDALEVYALEALTTVEAAERIARESSDAACPAKADGTR